MLKRRTKKKKRRSVKKRKKLKRRPKLKLLPKRKPPLPRRKNPSLNPLLLNQLKPLLKKRRTPLKEKPKAMKSPLAMVARLINTSGLKP